MEISFNGTIPVIFFREDDTFIAHCPVLDLSSCGATYDEALKNFREALAIFIEECTENGTLPQALEACGWKVHGKSKTKRTATPPVYLGEQQIAFTQLAPA